MLFEDLSDDWYGRVDWVGNDQDKRVGCGSGNAGSQVADNAGVNLHITIDFNVECDVLG